MGLTKQYLRYSPYGNFNIISSSKCNTTFVTLKGQQGRFIATGACENIIVWDLRLKEKAQVLLGDNSQVVYLVTNHTFTNLAAGFLNGNVFVYDIENAEQICKFSGHKSEITSLIYDNAGNRLASAAKDTDIVIWDTISEQGICRLSGHKAPVTQVLFMNNENILISSSKDTFIKFWDLNSQYCFKTLIGHKSEIFGLALLRDYYLVSGCIDNELKVWKISTKNKDTDQLDKITSTLELMDVNEDNDNDPNYPLQCHKAGTLLRTGKGRIISLKSDKYGQILGCLSSDRSLELFSFCTKDEINSRHKKRLKKIRKKIEAENLNPSEDNLKVCLTDEVKKFLNLKLENKCKSLDLVLGDAGELRLSINTSNNILDLYSFNVNSNDSDLKLLAQIKNNGHHSEVRAVAFSSDDIAVVSGSGDSLKLWNRSTQTCLRTVENIGYVLCVCFVPGDRHVLVGLKDGKLLIIDISAGDILEEIPAHEQELWSICLTPDQRGCITGGSDNTVKFWKFELIVDEKSEIKAKVLSLLHTRTLKLDDYVLYVCCSANNKFVAVALLDSTVKIFFVDSFKFFVSLYGHKHPVLCMDMSYDSTLIATGSGDRNVKIWGLDYGDCHKSIFAHDDSVTALKFVPKTHYFFTCGRDGKIKQWDADSFNKIVTLSGHYAECWSLAVSQSGKFVVSCGADKSIRLWERTEEILVLEDEEETEREEAEGLVTNEETVVIGKGVVTLPTKKTIGSEKAAESILECLEICKSHAELLLEYEVAKKAGQSVLPPTPHVLMQALQVDTCEDFLMQTFKNIRSSDLEEALLILPFSSVCEIIKYLPKLTINQSNIELICRIIVFLLRIHFGPIKATDSLLPLLINLKKTAFLRLQQFRDVVGYNYHSLQFIQHEIEQADGVQMFRDATLDHKVKERKKKKRLQAKRVLAMTS